MEAGAAYIYLYGLWLADSELQHNDAIHLVHRHYNMLGSPKYFSPFHTLHDQSTASTTKYKINIQ